MSDSQSDWKRRAVTALHEEGVLLVEDGNHGEYRPRLEEYGTTGIPFIRIPDMGNGYVDFEHADRIGAKARARIRKGIGAPGDVLISHKGTIGKVALAPLNSPEFVCSPQTTFWRSLDTGRLDRRFLFYYLQSPDFQRQFDSRKNETDMAGYVSLTAQRTFSLVVPPIEEQRAMAGVLGSLDDKIELNRRMNHTLEEICRALFKFWFVDFGPVRAKAAGRWKKGESLPGMPADMWDLWPSEFEESEIGEIPTGWKVGEVGSVVTVGGGSTPSTKDSRFWDGTIHWATPKDMAGLSAPVLLDTERKLTDEGLAETTSGLLPSGTVLLSSRAPIGYLAITEVPVAVNQGFITMTCSSNPSNHYMLNWAREDHEAIVAQANGTTFLEISKRNFRRMKILLPENEAIRKFTEIAQSLHEKLVSNLRQIETLAHTRDALLPKLLSGEIRVKVDA